MHWLLDALTCLAILVIVYVVIYLILDVVMIQKPYGNRR